MITHPPIKVSVISPVYKARPYIPSLLKSLRSQSLKDIEFIFIDDKGNDGSFDLIRQAAAEDSRIVCLENPENRGVSYSRNVGIRRAKGEFIAFVDADDYVNSDFYERLYNQAVSSKALVVKGSCLKAYPDGREEASPLNLSIARLYEQHDSMLNVFVYDFWTGLYSRTFVQKHHGAFPESYHRGEDIFFLTCLMPYLKKEEFAWDNEAIYYYRQHSESVIHRESGNNTLEQGKLEIESKMQFLLSLPDSGEVAHYMSNMLEGRLSWFIDNAIYQGADEKNVLSYLEVLANQIKLWKNSGRIYKAGVLMTAYEDLDFHASHFQILRKSYRKLVQSDQEISAQVNLLETRCKSIQESISLNRGRFDDINARISKISSLVGEQESRRKAMLEAISQNRSRFDDINARISKISGLLSEQENRRKAMLEAISQNRSRFDDINARISKISGLLSEQENRRKAMLEAISQNRSRFDDINARISKISGLQSEQENRRKAMLEAISQNRSRINDTNARISRISAGIDALRKQIRETSQGAQLCSNLLKDQESRLQKLASDIQRLNELVASNASADAERHKHLEQQLQDLQQKYDQQLCLAAQVQDQKLQQTVAFMQSIEAKHHRDTMLLLREHALRYQYLYYSIRALLCWGSARKRVQERTVYISTLLLEIKAIKESAHIQWAPTPGKHNNF